MNQYKIVLANFFTSKKKFSTLCAESHAELEEKVVSIGKKNPEYVVAAYLDQELQLALRPFQMMQEKNDLSGDALENLIFIAKWRINFFGKDQLMPDFSLPGSSSIFKKVSRKKFEPSKAIKPVRRSSKGQRAPIDDIVQKAA